MPNTREAAGAGALRHLFHVCQSQYLIFQYWIYGLAELCLALSLVMTLEVRNAHVWI